MTGLALFPYVCTPQEEELIWQCESVPPAPEVNFMEPQSAAAGLEALDVKMEKLNDLRQKHDDWANRQPETDGAPLKRYIDDAVQRLLHADNLEDKVASA